MQVKKINKNDISKLEIEIIKQRLRLKEMYKDAFKIISLSNDILSSIKKNKKDYRSI
jgi:hypothetical protein